MPEDKLFVRENSLEYLESLKSCFRNYFVELGYIEHNAVDVSSGIDPSVRFVGSTISVFKRHIIEGTIPDNGYFIIQDCLRTRNINYLFDDSHLSNWASCFPSFGTVSPIENLQDVCFDILDFLTKKLDIQPENIKIYVSSEDKDLINVVRGYAHFSSKNIEIDTKNKNYYRHKYGLDHVKGRNFNIALKNDDRSGFSDIGNVIIIEKSEKKLCVEVALGLTVILKQIFSLDHVLDCFPIMGIKSDNNILRRKFEDSIVTSTLLSEERIKPNASNSRGRSYRTYLRALSYFSHKTSLDMELLYEIITQYRLKAFPDSEDDLTEQMIRYIKNYEKELKNKKYMTREDVKILKAIRNN